MEAILSKYLRLKYIVKLYPIILILFALPLNAQTKEDVLAELKRQNVPHANIVLAQAILESGNFKSIQYKQTNNLFGIKKGKRYAIYINWKQSISDYKKRISSRYKGGSYYRFLVNIRYASDREYIRKLKKLVDLDICELAALFRDETVPLFYYQDNSSYNIKNEIKNIAIWLILLKCGEIPLQIGQQRILFLKMENWDLRKVLNGIRWVMGLPIGTI